MTTESSHYRPFEWMRVLVHAPRATQPSPALPLAVLLLAVTLLLTASSAAPGSEVRPAAAAARCGTSAAGAPACGAWWGMTLSATNSTTPASVVAQERSSGRRLDIVHTYHRWFDDFPTASEQALASNGHLLFVNWEPTTEIGAPMSWAAIASGRQDGVIDAAARRLATLPTVLVSFSHEPENDFGEHGSIADFVAAFRHVHDRMQADGATNVKWVWDVMGLSSPVWRANYRQLYPGDAYVDWIAWDPYNWAGCRGANWQTFAQVVGPFYGWLIANGFGGKPFMLAEYGTVEASRDPQAKASWFSAIPAALAAMPNLRALVYFDVPAPPANCDWRVGTSAQSAGAFGRLANSAPFELSAPEDPSGHAVSSAAPTARS